MAKKDKVIKVKTLVPINFGGERGTCKVGEKVEISEKVAIDYAKKGYVELPGKKAQNDAEKEAAKEKNAEAPSVPEKKHVDSEEGK